jgi:uncharacterized radical SAM protein YgiQ
MTELYKKVDAHPEVKKAFVGSGIRYDLLSDSYNKNADESVDEYLEQVVTCHISGRLKVAPEHTSDATLKIMRKPSFKHFHDFKRKYDKINKKHGLNQPLIPYFISSHPGSEVEDMANLAAETKDMGFKLEQVQDFTPTPMTVATIIYYTGLHPYTLKPIYTAKSKKEKKNQHLFFFWYKKENHNIIRDKLKSLGREDLIEKLIGDKKRFAKQQQIKNRRVNKFTKNKNKRRRRK